MKKSGKKVNILVIGEQKWQVEHKLFFSKLHQLYTVQYISDVQQAMQRLWHNSYDMLLIQQQFCKQNSIKLSQLSYARSKPSIILCNSIVMQWFYKFWKRFNRFTKVCASIRKLMYVYRSVNKNLLQQINTIANSEHNHRDVISLQIRKYFN